MNQTLSSARGGLGRRDFSSKACPAGSSFSFPLLSLSPRSLMMYCLAVKVPTIPSLSIVQSCSSLRLRCEEKRRARGNIVIFVPRPCRSWGVKGAFSLWSGRFGASITSRNRTNDTGDGTIA